MGSGELAATAYSVLRKGGQAVVVGVARPKDTTTLRTASLTFEEKSIAGSYFGSARPRVDAPRILGLYQAGKLKLDELITRTTRSPRRRRLRRPAGRTQCARGDRVRRRELRSVNCRLRRCE